MSDKQIIEDWQEKVRTTFGDQSKLYEYLFQTMDNFYYRYLETSVNKDLKTQNYGNHVWGIKTAEPSMVDALKIQNPRAKKGIISMAKVVPKAQGPEVRYSLLADVTELQPDHGEILFTASIDWSHPDFEATDVCTQKKVKFTYDDVGHFRKGLALKLEETCEIFL